MHSKLFWIPVLTVVLLVGAYAPASSQQRPTPAQPAGEPPPPTLVNDVLGKTWEWIGWTLPSGAFAVEEPARYTVQFERDGLVFIVADCNRGQANYFLPAQGQLAIHGMAVTKAACPSGSLTDRFVASLEIARSWYMADGDLVLEQPGETGTLRFRRKG